MASSYTCVCKRTFTAQNYFSQHQHSCSHTKKRLSSAISSFKQFVGRRKKPCISNDEARPVVDASPISDSHTDHPRIHAADTSSVPQDPEVVVVTNLDGFCFASTKEYGSCKAFCFSNERRSRVRSKGLAPLRQTIIRLSKRSALR
jgi:hypothetical protein